MELIFVKGKIFNQHINLLVKINCQCKGRVYNRKYDELFEMTASHTQFQVSRNQRQSCIKTRVGTLIPSCVTMKIPETTS